MRKKTIYCIDCGQEVSAIVIEQEERYTVKGDGPFTITAQVPICPRCKIELFDEEIEAENQKNLYEQYRRKHGLLLPEEIKAIREKYGLSQKSFSRLLGFGEVTIHRYESGSIQDKAHDMIIRKAESPAFMKECYERNPNSVSKREQKAFKERLEILLQEKEKADSWQNSSRSQIQKAIAVLLFLAHQVSNLSQKKAYCLMWYADMLHHKEFGTSITGLRYEKHLSGPVPEGSDFLLRTARTQGTIEIEEVRPFQAYSLSQDAAAFLTRKSEWKLENFLEDLSETSRIRISPRKDIDISQLSPSELRVLHFIIQEFGKHSSRKFDEVISREKAFQETKNLEFIPYDLARFLTFGLSPEKK